MQCNMLDAKNQLSKLVQAAVNGEDVVIANNGVPVVRLVKIGKPAATRKPGAWSALPKASRTWDSAASNAEIAAKISGSIFP